MSADPTPPAGPGMMRWLWSRYLRRHSWPLLLAFAMMMIEGSAIGLLSYMMKPMFDNIFVGGQTEALWWVGGAIFGLFLLRAVSSVVQRVVLTHVSQLSAAQMRTDLLDHVMTLDLSFHQTTSPGTLIERVQGDVQALGAVWTGIITGLGRDVVSVFWLFGVAIWVDWRWTLVALVGAPLLVLPSILAQVYVRKKARKAREVAAAMSTRLDEVFHGIAPIKLNRLERYQSDRYDALSEARVRAETRVALGQAAIPGFTDLMAGIGFFLVLLYGGGEIIAGEKSVGDFMAFFTAIGFAFQPLRRLGNLSGLWQSAAAAIERVQALFETTPTLVSPPKPAARPAGAPEIGFEDVRLAYEDLPVLNGVSFRAPAGRTTALVGASGAGKSTLFNLLTRLLDPASGRITLNGTPITDLAIDDLRGLISTVSQDVALFDETLRDNILLGRTDISEAHLEKTLRAAHVADFLPQLANGLDTPAGPRGSNLSGGQRQRVAIARALLRDTPILLLDEATSALDTKSETIVQTALDRLAEGRTTLVIAHRLSTIQNADQIVVMDRGRVADIGTHAELLARGGLYADLYNLQFRDGKQVSEPGRPTRAAPGPDAPPRKPGFLSRLFGSGRMP